MPKQYYTILDKDYVHQNFTIIDHNFYSDHNYALNQALENAKLSREQFEQKYSHEVHIEPIVQIYEDEDGRHKDIEGYAIFDPESDHPLEALTVEYITLKESK